MAKREIGFYDKESRTFTWVSVEKLKDAAAERRNNPVAPMVKQDTMNALRHPADGRHYDSKSAFDRVTKQHGLVDGWKAPKDWSADCTTIGIDRDAVKKDLDQALERTMSEFNTGGVQLSENGKLRAKEINDLLDAQTTTGSKLK